MVSRRQISSYIICYHRIFYFVCNVYYKREKNFVALTNDT